MVRLRPATLSSPSRGPPLRLTKWGHSRPSNRRVLPATGVSPSPCSPKGLQRDLPPIHFCENMVITVFWSFPLEGPLANHVFLGHLLCLVQRYIAIYSDKTGSNKKIKNILDANTAIKTALFSRYIFFLCLAVQFSCAYIPLYGMDPCLDMDLWLDGGPGIGQGTPKLELCRSALEGKKGKKADLVSDEPFWPVKIFICFLFARTNRYTKCKFPKTLQIISVL